MKCDAEATRDENKGSSPKKCFVICQIDLPVLKQECWGEIAGLCFWRDVISKN
jgi:hypothetical protein